MAQPWSRSDTILTAAVGAALLAWFLATCLGGLPLILDEGNQLATAGIILDGGTVGLHSNYPKLGAYLSAAWLGVFGRTLAAARIHTALVGAAIGVLLFMLVRRRVGRAAALGTALLFGAWSVPHWPVHSGDWPGVLTGLLALLALLAFRRTGRQRSLVAAGACVGLTGCYFPDLALLLLVLGAAALLLGWIQESGKGSGGGRVRRLGLLLGGLVAVVLPIALALEAAGALDRMIYFAFTGPAFVWQQFDQMYIPYPTSFSGGYPSAYYGDFPAARLVFLVPPLVAVAAVWLLLRREDATAWIDRVLLVAAAAASLLTIYPRSDLGHLVLALPLALPLLAEGAALAARSLGRRLSGPLFRLPAGAVLLACVALAAIGAAEARVHTLSGKWREPRGLEALQGFPVRADVARELEALAGLLDEWSEPGEPVFAYPDFTMFYYLFPEHPPPSPLLAQTFGWFAEDDLEELVEDLERRRVRIAVRLDINQPLDGRPLSAYAPLLTRYIAEQYQEVTRLGRLTVLLRRDRG